MLDQEARYNGLTTWLSKAISASDWQIKPLAGDASFRRYFRITTPTQTYIAMDAPPSHEDCRPFVAVLQVYAQHHVPVPRLINQAIDEGYLLLSDFGDEQYFKLLNEQSVDELYGKAFDTLLAIMQVPQDAGYHFPHFDYADFRRELSHCEEWFFRTHLQLNLSSHDQKMIDQQFDLLIAEELAQPQVCVHRDYHSRNLMLQHQQLGVLDFQDAVIGPITYDLVSLLRDCYIAWPRARVEQWVRHFYQRLQNMALLSNTISFEQYLRWFDLAGLQRHLKCMFIFARKFHRDGTTAFLGDIPRIVDYALDVTGRYSDLKPLQHFLTDHVVENLARAVA